MRARESEGGTGGGGKRAIRFRDPKEWLIIAALSASLIAILCEASKEENVK